jgi:hypothetical protein
VLILWNYVKNQLKPYSELTQVWLAQNYQRFLYYAVNFLRELLPAFALTGLIAGDHSGRARQAQERRVLERCRVAPRACHSRRGHPAGSM